MVQHPEDVRKRMDVRPRTTWPAPWEDFTLNTLSYAATATCCWRAEVLALKTRLRDRHVLVVVRGHDYKKDLSTCAATSRSSARP